MIVASVILGYFCWVVGYKPCKEDSGNRNILQLYVVSMYFTCFIEFLKNVFS